MSDPLQYTIGWICPIDKTFVAARAFLEEIHEPPVAVSQGDNNSYVLGRVSGHNVVIASVSGEYGTASAAVVTRDTILSFPNIRFYLMVGIGSGAPSAKHDIRLGDVVVGDSGVVQYDFRKTIQNQTFVETGSLSQPPISLLKALSTLEATYVIEGHRLDDKIKEIIKRYPQLQKTYSRPSASSDRLYKPSVSHTGPGEPCSEVCGDDISLLELRSERKEDEDNPAIHYGNIGTSTQLMKDALIRDQLAAERDILCFEIEAAGLMNHFPCLVIRGICDYADSHKNGEWHGYAAMAAAAFAKDLLCQIPPGVIEIETSVKEILTNISKTLNRIGTPANDTMIAVRTMHIEGVKNWLSPPDPTVNYSVARENRHEGTGTWFLESIAFKEWTTGVRQHLWLTGVPGSGKTVLITTILDHLSQIDDHTALRFFFDFSDTRKQSINAMCRSLAFQLYVQQEAPRKVLYELFALHDNGKKQPETEELSECLQAMLQVSAKVYIVLDALDECVDKTELLKWIQGFVSSPHLQNVQLLATSRPEEEFRRGIRKFIGDRNYITLDESSVNEDIRTYIGNRMKQSPMFKRWILAAEELEDVQNKVGERSGGQFRWAACQLDTLERNLTPAALRSMLDDPPQEMDDSPQETLSEAYDRIILEIPPEFKSEVLRLLQFLVHAERSVTLAEAVDHISTQTENGQVDIQRRLLAGENIQSYCPLISVIETLQDGKSIREVHLAHSSVKDYLMRRSEFQLAPNTASVAFAESYGPSSVASQIFSEEAVSTKQSSLEDDIGVVVENHATRQMAKTFYSHKHIKSSCDDINDDIRSLASGPEDIQSQDGSNSTRWEVKEAAANYLADMLINNPKLGPLYEEALKGLNDARFVRNHGRLLKRYYLSLLSQAPSQKQGAAIDFLRPRSHRTLISSKVLVHMGREMVPVTLPQDYERNLILERYLNKVNETPVAPNIDEGDGTESSEDEDDEEDFHQGLAFVDLEDAKSYFVSGTPLMQFETEFRDFLHPSCKVAIETQEETQSQVNKETEQGVNAEPCGWSHNIVCLKNRLSSRLYDTCYPPKLGYQRVWYICECGDRMFLDVKELSPGGVQRFRQRFAKDGLARLLGVSYAMTDQDATAGDDSRSGISAPPPAHLRSERGQSTSSTQSPGPSNFQLGKESSASVSDTSGSEEVALPPEQQDTSQYLLLCVNQKSLPVLDHIDCSSFGNDQYLFQQILGRYRTIREGSAWRIPLLFPASVCALVGRVMASLRQKTPSWLEGMFQFFRKLSEASLFEMHTGEYVKFQLVPMGDETTKPHHFRCGEYPPELEVQGKRYLYDPVPTDVAIDAIPLWHLTKPGVRHSDNYWITTFPKKLQGPLRRERGTSARIIGWGIRVNERFNWHLFFSLLLVILVVIWAIVAIYLACKADDSSGFGLGALLAAFAAVYVPLQYQAWKEKLD